MVKTHMPTNDVVSIQGPKKSTKKKISIYQTIWSKVVDVCSVLSHEHSHQNRNLTKF